MKKRFKHRKFQAIETFTMGLSFWWFIVLALPLNTFTGSSSYIAMSGIADETLWALSFLLIAVIQLVGMLLNACHIKQLGLILSMGIWLFISVAIYLGNQTLTGIGTYLLASLLCGWLYVKVGDRR